MLRRDLLKAPALAIGAWASTHAFAQSTGAFPTRPVTWVVPYPAGATTDLIARTLSNEIQKEFSQPLVVDYKPGAATSIGAEYVSRAAPDGHTLMSADNAALAYNQFIYAKLPYDPNKSFTLIGAIGRLPMALAVHPSVPAQTAQEFLAWVKSNPGKGFYGSPGIGSPHHLNMEYFLDAVGVPLQHVPYKGGAPAINALLSGEIQAMMVDLPLGREFANAGKIRMLALAADKRAASLPQLPTFDEAGLPKMSLSAWQGVIAPAGTPKAVVERLNAALNTALRSDAFRDRFSVFAFEIMPGTPQAFEAFVRAEQAQWGPFIQRKGISNVN